MFKMMRLVILSMMFIGAQCIGNFNLTSKANFNYRLQGWEIASVDEVNIFKRELQRDVKNTTLQNRVKLTDGCMSPNYETQRSKYCCTLCSEMLLIKDLWTLQQSNVCFGTKDNSYGTFTLTQSGGLSGIKLVYKSGSVYCGYSGSITHFGCRDDEISVAITDTKDQMIYPEHLSKYGIVKPSLYGANSSAIIFTDERTPEQVEYGEEMRLWYGQDLVDHTEVNNEGRSCVDVYAAIIEKEEKEISDNTLIYVLAGVGVFILLFVLIVLLIGRRRRRNDHVIEIEDKEKEKLKTDDIDVYEIPDVVHNTDTSRSMIYSDLGKGGRTGNRPDPTESEYAQVKTEGVHYPALINCSKEELYSNLQ